jgi:hypothetical protein
MMKILLRPNHEKEHWEVCVTFGPTDTNTDFYIIGSEVEVPAETVLERVRRANPGAIVELA